MTIPNLAGVITKADIDTKGTGSYAASYVNWAKVAHLLHEHAPGWEFHLKPTTDGSLIWQAPDATAYVIGYFTGPEDQATADFPFPAMDNRNNPIAFDKISARTLTDTHRRALCAAAAFSLGLAYELWAKEEVENPHREEEAAPAKKAAPAAAKSAPKPATPTQKAAPVATPEASPEPPIDPAERKEILSVLQGLMASNRTAFDAFVAEYRTHFNLPEGMKLSDHMQERQHGDFAQQFLSSLPAA